MDKIAAGLDFLIRFAVSFLDPICKFIICMDIYSVTLKGLILDDMLGGCK